MTDHDEHARLRAHAIEVLTAQGMSLADRERLTRAADDAAHSVHWPDKDADTAHRKLRRTLRDVADRMSAKTGTSKRRLMDRKPTRLQVTKLVMDLRNVVGRAMAARDGASNDECRVAGLLRGLLYGDTVGHPGWVVTNLQLEHLRHGQRVGRWMRRLMDTDLPGIDGLDLGDLDDLGVVADVLRGGELAEVLAKRQVPKVRQLLEDAPPVADVDHDD